MRRVLAVLWLAFAACGGSEAKCKGVTCSPGRQCVPATGACEVPDAGP